MSTSVESLPGGLTTVAQLHSLSVDVAKSFRSDDWKTASLPTYAAIRKHATPTQESRPKMLVQTKRRARQQALREARNQFQPSMIPVVSLADMSTTSTSCSSLQKTASHSTDNDSSFGGLSGTLFKRGRVTRRILRRHYVLWGSTLYNYRSESDDRPTWKLPLGGAKVATDDYSRRIVLFIDGKRLVLFANDDAELELWANALVRAADQSAWATKHEAKKFAMYSEDGANIREETNVEWDSFRSLNVLKFRTGGNDEDSLGNELTN